MSDEAYELYGEQHETAAPAKHYAKTGRPTLYHPSYCDEVVELGRLGKSYVQMAAHFDVGRNTLDGWRDTYPEFSEALTRAKALAQQWWEDTGQTAMMQPGFNALVWKTSMAARFREDYTERREIDTRVQTIPSAEVLGTLTDEQIEQLRQIAQTLALAKPK